MRLAILFMSAPKKSRSLLINLAFVGSVVAILFFLLQAPEVTTPRLPHDDDHERFFPMKKKKASALCVECHTEEDVIEIHKDKTPNTNRCLFCHRRD